MRLVYLIIEEIRIISQIQVFQPSNPKTLIYLDIVHGDVKCENVLVFEDEDPDDTGIGKIMSTAHVSNLDENRRKEACW